jgi:hypothetical protein
MLKPGRYTWKALFVPKVKYETLDTSKQYGASPDSEKQTLLICGLPTASKKILTAKDVYSSMPAPGTPILNNLTSPEARGSFGTVAQEETPKITIPPNKIIINIDLIEITSFYYLLFFFLSLSRFTTLTIYKNSSLVKIPFSTSNLVRAFCWTTWDI